MTSTTLAIIDELSRSGSAAIDSLARSCDAMVVLTCNDETFAALNDGPYTVYLAQELFAPDDVVSLDNLAVSMIRTRFFMDANGHELTEYSGLPIADIGEQAFVRPTIEALRTVVSVGKAIAKCRAGRVVLIGPGPFTLLALEAARAASIPFVSVLRTPLHSMAHGLRTVRRFFSEGRPLTTFKVIYMEPILTALLTMAGLWARLRRAIAGETEESSKRLCVLSASPHIKPVYEHLRQSGQWDFVLMGIDLFGRRRAFPGLKPIEAYMSVSAPLRALWCCFHYMRLWMRLSADREFAGKFEHEGVSLWPVMKGVIRGIMLLTFPRIYLEHLVAVDAIERIGRRRAVVLSHYDSTHDIRTVVDAARQAGVPTLLLQHALMGECTAQERIFSGAIAGWGKRSREWFGQHGYPRQRIAVLGPPFFDNRLEMLKLNAGTLSPLELGLSPDRKTVLVITSGGEGLSVSTSAMEDYYMLRSVYDAIEQLGLGSEVQVAIKTHPSQNMTLITRLLNHLERPGIAAHMFSDRLDPLLSASHVVVGRYSTVLFEAMFFDKPSVVFDYLMKKELVPYVPYEAALGASNSKEMANALSTLLGGDPEVKRRLNAGRKRFIDYAITDTDGKALERLEAFITRMADGEIPEDQPLSDAST
jgi:hypothetical protein